MLCVQFSIRSLAETHIHVSPLLFLVQWHTSIELAAIDFPTFLLNVQSSIKKSLTTMDLLYSLFCVQSSAGGLLSKYCQQLTMVGSNANRHSSHILDDCW